MKEQFSVHPITVIGRLKSTVWILFLPFLKEAVTYLMTGRFRGFFSWENFSVTVVFLWSALQIKALKIKVFNGVLSVQSGLIFRRERRIACQNISSVTKSVSLIDALFHTVSVSIYCDADRRKRPFCKASFRQQTANLLTERLLGGETRLETVQFAHFRWIGGALGSASFVSGALVIFSVITQVRRLERVLPVAFSAQIVLDVEQIVLKEDSFIAPMAKLILLLLLGAFLAAFFRSFGQNFAKKIGFGQQTVTVVQGFLVRREVVFRIARLHAISCEQSWLFWLIGRSSLTVSFSGGPSMRKDDLVLLPFLNQREANKLFFFVYQLLRNQTRNRVFFIKGFRGGQFMRQFTPWRSVSCLQLNRFLGHKRCSAALFSLSPFQKPCRALFLPWKKVQFQLKGFLEE